MSIETVTGDRSQTFLLIHPPGLSIRDSDGVVESVRKQNQSTAVVKDAVLFVAENLIDGERWAPYAGLHSSLRYGHAVADSPSGTPTVSIIRHPRHVVPVYSGVTYRYETNTAQLLNQKVTSRSFVIGMPEEVQKPSAESWGALNSVYYWEHQGQSGYTTSPLITARDYVRFAGVSADTYGVGVTTAYVCENLINDTETSFFRVVGSEAIELDIPIVAGSYQMGSNLMANLTRTAIGSISTTTDYPLHVGILAGVDKTVTPTKYFYHPTINLGTAPLDALYMQHGQRRVGFIQCTPTPWPNQNGKIVNPGWENYLPQTEWFCIQTRFTAHVGQISLMAPRIVCTIGIPVIDLAMDVDLSSPWILLRIIYTPCTNDVPSVVSLYPSTCRRTDPDEEPHTGMARNAVRRPPWTVGQVNTRATGRSAGSYLSGPNLFTTDAHYVRGHNTVPYSWNGYKVANPTNLICRIAEMPSSIRIVWSVTGMEWAWARTNFNGTPEQITPYVSALAGFGGTYADLTPPPLPDSAACRLYLLTKRDGSAIPPTQDSNPIGYYVYWNETNDGEGYGCYPYDIGECELPSDSECTWAGHCGWHWPIDPVLPAITWPTPPAFTRNNGNEFMTLSAQTAPTATPTQDIGSPSLSQANNVLIAAVAEESLAALRFVSGTQHTWSMHPPFQVSPGLSFKLGKPSAGNETVKFRLTQTAHSGGSTGNVRWYRTFEVPITF